MARSRNKKLHGKARAHNYNQQQRGAQEPDPGWSSRQPTGHHISDFNVEDASSVTVGSTSVNNVKGGPTFVVHITMPEFLYNHATRVVGDFDPDLPDVVYHYATPLATEAHHGTYPSQRHRGYRDSSFPLSDGQPGFSTSPTQHKTRVNGPIEDQETPEDQQLPLSLIDPTKPAERKQRRPTQDHVKTGSTCNGLKNWSKSLRPRKQQRDCTPGNPH